MVYVSPIPISVEDQHQVVDLYEKMQQSHAKLVGPDGRSHKLPATLYEFLVQLVGDLVAGESITILQDNSQVTTVEAARMLGVSRQFLVQEVEKGALPFHKVGTHRRIYVRDVLAYKHRRDQERRKTLSDLTKASVAEGLYDIEPTDVDPLDDPA